MNKATFDNLFDWIVLGTNERLFRSLSRNQMAIEFMKKTEELQQQTMNLT